MKKSVMVKNVEIGGEAPVSIQSMTNTKTYEVKNTIRQIQQLRLAGADIVRVAVPDAKSVKALYEIVRETESPIVADIQYDYKLALASIEAGAHKIRMNPSNTSPYGIREVAALARERGVPIRIGVNRGSIQSRITAEELADAVMDNVKMLEDMEFTNMVLAVKASDVRTTVEAYRCLDKLCDYPLHIGVTEAGTENTGALKSLLAIGSLLLDGIGNTMRVSLSAHPEKEVLWAKKILRLAEIDQNYAQIISCPTCARCSINVAELAKDLENRTLHVKKPLKIAVMGCVVNGIGESKNADFGVAGGDKRSTIFKNGRAVKLVNNDKITEELLSILKEYEQ